MNTVGWAFLIDLDGTVYTEHGPIPGAVEALAHLQHRGIPFLFVTNTTCKPCAAIVQRLGGYGISTSSDRVFTAVRGGADYLRRRGLARVAPFLAAAALEDLRGFEFVGGTSSSVGGSPPEAVLVGDLGADLTHALLNEAFRYVMDGAELVALQRGRYWLAADGLELDAGAYVAALEFATGKEAVVCGKPNPEFFRGAVASLGATEGRRVVMIGDDLWSDVRGAQEAGLEGWLVRTGKFREDQLVESGVKPDRVVDSLTVLFEMDL